MDNMNMHSNNENKDIAKMLSHGTCGVYKLNIIGDELRLFS